MASTAQQVRPSTVTKEKSFMDTKRNLAIAISSIAYLRHLFPSDAFRERKLDTMRIWILKQNSQARHIVEWMNGVYDALEKEYLERLVLVIKYKSLTTGKDILETYSFGFTYAGREILTDMELANSGHPTRSAPMTLEDTKKSAQKFIKKLFLLVSGFEDVGPNFAVSMRLSYYDERTPVGYQPPGFESGDLEGFDTESEMETFNVGKMEQGFHTTSLVVKRAHLLAAPTQGYVPNHNAVETQFPIDPQSQNVAESQHIQCGVRQTNPSNEPNSQVQGTQIVVRCPCGYNENEGTMISCMSCAYWQHAVCFCICPDNAPDVHVCNVCADPTRPELYPTDATLCDLDVKRLREVCNWRRALEACFSTNSITVNSLSSRLCCTKVLAKKIVNQMVEGRIANPNKDRKSIKDINKANLEKAYYRDIQKPSADMRQQAAEARSNFQSPSDSGYLRSQGRDDITPVKSQGRPSTKTAKPVKRKLGMSSQDSDFKACSEKPKRLRATKRS